MLAAVATAMTAAAAHNILFNCAGFWSINYYYNLCVWCVAFVTYPQTSCSAVRTRTCAINTYYYVLYYNRKTSVHAMCHYVIRFMYSERCVSLIGRRPKKTIKVNAIFVAWLKTNNGKNRTGRGPLCPAIRGAPYWWYFRHDLFAPKTVYPLPFCDPIHSPHALDLKQEKIVYLTLKCICVKSQSMKTAVWYSYCRLWTV